MTRLLLIRHGESALGARGRYAGHTDTPLTPQGRRQVLKLRSSLRRYRIHHSYSSDLVRCRETAELLGLAPAYSKRLRELDFGRWDGLTSAECARRSPRHYRRWISNPRAVAPPDGESLRELRCRVSAFVRKVVKARPRATIALVTHGGPIRVLLASRLGDFWSVAVPPASLHVCRRGGK